MAYPTLARKWDTEPERAASPIPARLVPVDTAWASTPSTAFISAVGESLPQLCWQLGVVIEQPRGTNWVVFGISMLCSSASITMGIYHFWYKELCDGV